MTATPPARVAYDAFAPFYDDFTGDHDYEAWTASLEGLARAAGLHGRRLLDVACGTGKSFLPMLSRGYAVAGCDLSPGMLERAREKSGSAAALHECDLRALPRLGEFDLVWCLGDALNYLGSEAELRDAFDGMALNLAPAGVLIFDVNTLATFRTVYSSLLVLPRGDRVLLYEGRGSPDLPPGGVAEATIDQLAPAPDGTGWWTRVRSEHRHRHHPDAELRHALDAAGLECVGRHGNHVDGVIDADADESVHTKIVYVARRARARAEGGG